MRVKHTRLTYESFEAVQSEGRLTLRFLFHLEPGISFRPSLEIPLLKPVDPSVVHRFAFHLGLVEAISYWKAACPPELLVEAGALTEDQVVWWKDLFLHGLGEFFYKNTIDFTKKDFLTIASSGPQLPSAAPPDPASRDLVLVGGGKDSAVTLELLKKSGRPTRPLVLNPTRAALDTIKIAGKEDPIIVRRRIDPTLLALNHKGYLNGHTPFSTYLAFLGLFVAVLYGYEHVIVGNESSANEGNVMFHGIMVNHQYSKSYRFEKLFREYVQKYLTKKHNYFSFLRPLNELQISKIFSQYPQYFSSFRSCNVGSKTDTWCGACAKCAFVYLSLAPFISRQELVKIFGSDLFTKPEIMKFIDDMTKGKKPFECVGTREEVRLALAGETNFSFWNPEHFVPEEYLKLLPYGRNSR